MSEQSVVDRPPITEWLAETLRLTAFPSPATEITKPSWWEDLVGELPENRISQPRKGGQQDEGPFEGGKLTLGIQLDRIDWLFTAADDQVSIGSFPESLEPFLRLMLRWFELCPPVQRLAFGAVLILPVTDRNIGYRQISAYLPSVQVDPEGSSDLSYQINRPRNSTSGVTGLRINRLTRWSVSMRRRAELSFRPASVGYFLGSESHACRLELDINTAPDFQGELPTQQLPRIFQELVDLGKEIVREGDIP